MKRLLSAVGLILVLAAGQAHANLLYTFSGTPFDDGETLTGSFTTDDAITSLIDFDLTTSGAGVGFNYTPATAISTSTSLPLILVVSSPALDHILQVTFAGGLTATGALVTLGTFDSFEQSGTIHRDITGGSAVPAPTSVPEPSTLALLALVLVGLLVRARARRST